MALKSAAHSLKGSMSTFAAGEAIEAALRLEGIAGAGEFMDADDAYALLAAQLERLKQALKSLGERSKRFQETVSSSSDN